MSLVSVALSELPALAAFINVAYRGQSAELGWAHEAGYITGQRTNADMLRDDLAANPEAQLLAWRESETLMGCVWLEPDADGLWKLGLLTVRPDQQDRGLGRTLLAAAEAHAAARGARRIGITVVHLRDALIAWYERRGYVRTGETAPFPYEDQRFGVPIRDDLSFILMEKQL